MRSKATHELHRDFRQPWKSDLVASLSVALVALPLGLGVALASGAPPVAGLVPSIIGGLLVTWVRGRNLAVNGPSKGLVPVVLVGLTFLDDGSGNAYRYMLAAFVIAGGLQLLSGVLGLGKLGRYLPAAVISGMLAAIGVIIITSQVPSALGTHAHTHRFFETLKELPELVMHAHPGAVVVSLISLVVLWRFPLLPYRWVAFLPTSMWVILLSFPLALGLNWLGPQLGAAHSAEWMIGEDLLVDLPARVWEHLPFPDFSQLGNPWFWLVVFSVFLVASVESLLSARAVDQMDGEGRKVSLNRDLAANGGATIVSAFLGGLPVITVVLCSAVNLNHGARTRWSNAYQALLLLFFLLLLSPFLSQVPLAALAAILMVTGYKLTALKVYQDALRKGWEQLALLIGTLLACMLTGLLPGLFLGILATVLLHWAKTGIPAAAFWRFERHLQLRVLPQSGQSFLVRIKGVVNFLTLSQLESTLRDIPPKQSVVLDFSLARLVDYTTLEYLHEYAENYHQSGGDLDLTGLGIHKVSSDHPYALHVLESARVPRLSRRQARIKELAALRNYTYLPEIDYRTAELRKFDFFSYRPVEYTRNRLQGLYPESSVYWEISDVSFSEGALMAQEVYHLTVQVLTLPRETPAFTLTREGFLDKMLQFAVQEDIDFSSFPQFSSHFVLRGPDETAIRTYFTPELIGFFEVSDVYHVETQGHEVLVFRHQRLASNREIESMIEFCEGLSVHMGTSLSE